MLAGDRDAFRVLVEREGPAIVRACYRVLGDLHEAEDAAQEAFVTAYRSLAGWRAEGPFGAWLSRIAVRIALRQAARRRPVAWIEPGTAGDGPLGGRLGVMSGGQADPAISALRAERAAAVRAAVARLDEPYRDRGLLRLRGELSEDADR